MSLRIGIDIGSTTVKVVLLDEQNKLLFRSYERHYSKARERAAETLRSLADRLAGRQVRIVITGSAGLGVAKAAEIDFVQEVYATAAAVNQYIPDTDAVIELGGEDAKIIFFGGALEERMNGSCAGGTGAFIDQMATLMNVSVNELDSLSLKHEKIYPIASRCGVFAKSDIQPILNQGGRKEDVAASIFQAVVDQTVAGLTQGRELKGKIVFLGGPLHFLMGLRQRFVETLKLDGAHLRAHLDAFQLHAGKAQGVGPEGGPGGEHAHAGIAAQTRRPNGGGPAVPHRAGELPHQPDVAEILQPAHGVGAAVFRGKDHLAPQAVHQPALPRDAELGGKGSVDVGNDLQGHLFGCCGHRTLLVQ